MAKKKAVKKVVRKSSSSSSQSVFQKHPNLVILLILFVCAIVVSYVLKMYEDTKVDNEIMQLNSNTELVVPHHVKLTPSLSPSAQGY